MGVEMLILIVILGLLFDYTNGFHDAANVVSTVIATRVLTPLSAIVMAATLNFIGATQISGVAQTVATGLVHIEHATELVVFSAIISAIIWNIITWYYGIPSSSSYALIGGLLGAAIFHQNLAAIIWKGVFYKVAIPMIVSPILGFSIGIILMKILNSAVLCRHKDHSIFKHLQIGSSCFVALSHGLNDAQKSMGIITLGLVSANVIASPTIPLWVILSCAIVMGLGTASGGFRIINTMGFSITKIDPMQGFAAESSTSIVILAASFLGMPISSTHMIAGSITGVGAAQGRHAVNWHIPLKILFAMLITIPGSALVSALVFSFSRFLLA